MSVHGDNSKNISVQDVLTHKCRFYTKLLLHTETSTHGAVTRNILHTEGVHTQEPFTHKRFLTQRLLHTEVLQRCSYTKTFCHMDDLFYTPNFGAFTHRCTNMQKLLRTQRCFYTEKDLHKEGRFLHTRITAWFYTRRLFTRRCLYAEIHAEAFIHFAHKRFFKHKSFCTGALHPQVLIITGRKFFHTESFYTAVLFHTRNLLQADAFIYTQKPLHTEAITHRNFYTGASTHKCNFYRWKHTHTHRNCAGAFTRKVVSMRFVREGLTWHHPSRASC